MEESTLKLLGIDEDCPQFFNIQAAIDRRFSFEQFCSNAPLF